MNTSDGAGRVETLITAALRSTDRSRDDLAHALGISRTTLWRKLHTLDADSLRTIAGDTAIDYPALLRAALHDAGLITNDNELLDGLTLTTVTQVDSDSAARAETVAVFTDPSTAAAYADLANDLARGDPDIDYADYQTSTIRVDTSASISSVTAYTARWASHTDTVTVDTRRYAELPRALTNNDGVSDFHARTATQPVNGSVDNIVELAVTATTEHLARTALDAKLDALRATGALATLNQPLPWRERGPTRPAPVTQTVPGIFAAHDHTTPPVDDDRALFDYLRGHYSGPPFDATLPRHGSGQPTLSNPDVGENNRVSIALDGPSQQTQTLLHDVYDTDLTSVLVDVLIGLRDQVSARLRDMISAQLRADNYDPPVVQDPFVHTEINVTHLTFDDSREMFEVQGQIHAHGTSRVAISSVDSEWIEREALLDGTFAASIYPGAKGADVTDIALHPTD